MNRNLFRTSLLIAVGMLLGVFIGFGINSRNQKQILGSGTEISFPSQEAWAQMVAERMSHSDTHAPILAAYKEMVPLVRAGPFVVALNPTNGDYLIDEIGFGHPLVQQVASSENTCLDFYVRQIELLISIELSKDHSEVQRVSYSVGGLTTPSKYSYTDDNGDGQFDKMIDYRAGAVYEQQGLVWVKFRDITKWVEDE